MRARRLFLLCVSSLLLHRAAAQDTASVLGRVTDEGQRPIAGAVVHYNRVTDFTRASGGRLYEVGPIISSAVRTGPDGSFSVTGLPAGRYWFCASGTVPAHIASCRWVESQSPVILSTGQSLASLALTVRSGTVIRLIMLDPGRRLDAGAKFFVGVMNDKGAYEVAKPAVVGSGSREHRVTIPRDASVRLFFDTDLNPVDQAGQPLEVGRPGLRVSAQGREELSLTFTLR